jgi:hypothetical protein
VDTQDDLFRPAETHTPVDIVNRHNSDVKMIETKEQRTSVASGTVVRDIWHGDIWQYGYDLHGRLAPNGRAWKRLGERRDRIFTEFDVPLPAEVLYTPTPEHDAELADLRRQLVLGRDSE